ncbi:MAG: Gfo/Idh/MocA family oxidoreductase [Tannerellaceae bacterium]|nr:Gfo/Idh/MocA family oxidoreductase [Tannerellaceae bacterium]
MKHRKLRMGMIGGGHDSFIGTVHRSAAFLDNQIELVCGCFSVDPVIARESGLSYFLPEERIYSSYKELFEKEKELPEGERMDFVTIVTPNFLHFEPAMIALENGFHVVVDKPVTFSLEEAKLLQKKVEETGLLLALTHVYSGYPAIKEMKDRVRKEDIGKLRKVCVEYPQGWLAERIELQSGNNAGWRTDPKRSGKAGCVGDIGTHAWHLAEYVTGLKVQEVSAELTAFVEGRMLDDDCTALLRFEKGVKGVLVATQIAAGEANNIRLRVYGEQGGMEWRQEEPNTLYVKRKNGVTESIKIGNNTALGEFAAYYTRVPAGHPEGFYEAFANIYRNFAYVLRDVKNGREPDPKSLDFPTIEDGVRGMQFIETMVASGYDEVNKWQKWIE